MWHKIFEKRERFAPDLINLRQYEMALLYAREHGKMPIPVRPWHDNHRWTDSESQYMRDNRAQAQAIMDRIFPKEEG